MNTIAADSKGKALYADIGSIPNVDEREGDRLLRRRSAQVTFPAARPAGARRLALGVRASPPTPTRRPPGIMGASQQPLLERRDYVANGNDSYWLTNPEQPLEGFARIIGEERTQRSLRDPPRAEDDRAAGSPAPTA